MTLSIVRYEHFVGQAVTFADDKIEVDVIKAARYDLLIHCLIS